MTLAESILWKELRGRRLPYKIRRQVPIGIYIVDFLCVECRLVIEVDGPIHETQQEYDQEREAVLRQKGYRVLRLMNDDVINHRVKTLAYIEQAMQSST